MTELRLLQLLTQREKPTMKPGIDPSYLSNQDLSVLEQQILAERSRRVMSSPNVIVVEADAPEELHAEAIKKLLERKSQNE